MEKLKLLKGDFACKLSLALAPTIKAGFPSPADDYLHDSLDFNRDLIKNPEATFYGRVSGDSMIEAVICDGDIAVIVGLAIGNTVGIELVRRVDGLNRGRLLLLGRLAFALLEHLVIF